MPPERRGLSEDEIRTLFARLTTTEEHLKNIDAHLAKQDEQMECVLEAINGTAQVKGLAGHIRDYRDWRAEIEKDAPLAVRLLKIEEFQADVLRLFVWFGVPLVLTVLIGVLGFVWGMLTNNISIVVK